MCSQVRDTVRLQKRISLIFQLREIEKEHGSITNIPSDSIEVKQIEEIFPKKQIIKPRRRYMYNLSKKQIAIIEGQIVAKILDGLSVNQVADQLHISEIWVRRTLRKRRIKTLRPFKYKLSDPKSELVLFTTNKESLLRYMLNRSHHDKFVKEKLQQSYMLEEGKFYWYEVPSGAWYIYNNRIDNTFVLRIK